MLNATTVFWAVFTLLSAVGMIVTLWVGYHYWRYGEGRLVQKRRQLLEEFQKLRESRALLASNLERLESEVRRGTKCLVSRVVRSREAEADIRDLKEFGATYVNWSALEAHGVSSVADLITFLENRGGNLSSLRGIGETSARRLRGAVGDKRSELAGAPIGWNEVTRFKADIRQVYFRALQVRCLRAILHQAELVSREVPEELRPPGELWLLFGFRRRFSEKVEDCREAWHAEGRDLVEQLKGPVRRVRQKDASTDKWIDLLGGSVSFRRLSGQIWKQVPSRLLPDLADVRRVVQPSLVDEQAVSAAELPEPTDAHGVAARTSQALRWVEAHEVSNEKELGTRIVAQWLKSAGYGFEREYRVEFQQGSQRRTGRIDFLVQRNGDAVTLIENKLRIRKAGLDSARDQAVSYTQDIEGLRGVMVAAIEGVWVFELARSGPAKQVGKFEPRELDRAPREPFKLLEQIE